jgi:agmatine deiminase
VAPAKPRVKKPKVKTPKQLGFRMPAEWENHEAVWLAWPYEITTFPVRLENVEKTYIQIIKELHMSERINLFVTDDFMKHRVMRILHEEYVHLERVKFFSFPYADVWFRDYGPIFVKNRKGELAMTHWRFNAWGGKYDDLQKDRQIPDIINQYVMLQCFEPDIVLEGGSIEVNGKGTLLTTEQCLLNTNRNPQLKKKQIEKYLTDYLGATNIVWLKRGILGDDTDGHIDDLARFVNPTTVVCAFEDDPNGEDYEVLKENYEILQQSVDQKRKKLKIVKLPMPKVISDSGEWLPASYTNFFIGNEKVLVPTFRHPNDEKALAILQQQFPNRKVIGIESVELLYGFGAIHCITQQQPASPP